MRIILVAVLVALAVPVGLVAPDIDQRVSWLTHRSALTHAPWFALIAVGLALKVGARPLLWMAAAFCLRLAIHFGLDLFPKAWQGYALFHIPLYGRLASASSFLWIVTACAASLACGVYAAWRAITQGDVAMS